MSKELERLINRRIENIYPSKEIALRFLEEKPRSFYLGIDPTGPDLHIGHAVPVMFLKNIKKINPDNKIIILFGDFTARIGDPSGKTSTRIQLTKEQVEKNMSGYIDQVSRVIPEEDFEIRRNGDWLSKMTFEDVIKLASRVTVQQMIQRDMFQERIKSEQPIGVHEFLYPLMQGYDSVAMEIDAEVGGNDQTFNMLVGRDLVKDIQNREKLVFATKLLVNPQTGGKMSKTEGSLISLNDSPEDMYGKAMANIPDDMIETVFLLCTDIPEEEISAESEKVKSGGNPVEFKRKLAAGLVETYWGKDMAVRAVEAFEKISSGGVPDNIPSAKGSGDKIVEFLVANGFGSASHVKGLIKQGAVRVNGEVCDWGTVLNSGDSIKVGPHRFISVQ